MFTMFTMYKHQFCVAVVETGSKGASNKKKRLLLNLANQQNQDGAAVNTRLPCEQVGNKPSLVKKMFGQHLRKYVGY